VGETSQVLVQEDSAAIPNKLYFRIGEVARLTGVKPYVLRYWETEFPELAPKKSGSKHRLYRRKDVELLLEIKRLLYEKRFTIEGARKFLHTRSAPVAPQKKAGQVEMFQTAEPALSEIRKELQEILRLLV
jgi:DNA-binding transcriptional MerR regulator